jgi:ATPase subunit of ABC transporter with duplicated ATPase domains
MLHIDDLCYRGEGRTSSSTRQRGIPEGDEVGLVGRNGTGMATLPRLIAPESGRSERCSLQRRVHVIIVRLFYRWENGGYFYFLLQKASAAD